MFLSCRGPSSRRRAIIDIQVVCARPFAVADYLCAAICRHRIFARGHSPLPIICARPFAVANYLRAAIRRPAISDYLRAVICRFRLFARDHSPPGHADYLRAAELFFP